MNFQSILIVTYGRSGSTLLQGIMNSHEEVLVRGENYNFCFHLFEGYKSLLNSKSEDEQRLPKDPFFGNALLDEENYIKKASETVKEILLGDQIDNPNIRAFGFKEIRYEGVLEYLPAYLDFLKRIFPNPVFVFNTRKREAVIKSRLKLRWIVESEFQSSMDRLARVESVFAQFHEENPKNSFHITYEDVIIKAEKLKAMHAYIGLAYSASKMDSVLGEIHSYAPQQDAVKEKIVKVKQEGQTNFLPGNPLLTVLLCTYNDEGFLREAIQSILDQEYKNFEFIIVNDGSTDSTKEIIHSYTDPRIRYLEHEENKGLEDSKNWGLEEAQGKYVAYMDGDDISLPERLLVQAKFMEEHPDVGLCASAVTVFGNKSTYYHPAEKDLDIRCRALVGTPLNHPSLMVRMSTIKEHNIRYRKGFKAAEDHPFMLDVLKVTKAYCFPKVLLKYRWHEQNLSVQYSSIQKASAVRSRNLAFKELAGVEVTDLERELYVKFWRNKCEAYEVKQLENLRDKIFIDEHLSAQNSEFRYYLKSRLSETIEKLYEELRGYYPLLTVKDQEIEQLNSEIKTLGKSLHSANFEINSMLQSLSWKLTYPVRFVGNKLFRMKTRD